MEEKEFEPTRKKLKKARFEGKVVHSNELALGLFLLASMLILNMIGPLLFRRCQLLFSFQFTAILTPLLIILGTLFVVAYLVHFMQIGFIWAWPKKGRQQRRFFFPLVKLLALLAVFYFFFKTTSIPRCTLTSQIIDYWARSLFHLGLALSLVLVILGIADYLYQRHRFFKEMRMTRQEKKEELR